MHGHDGSDSAELAQFGYKQELHRTLGSFSSFAAGFSYISILTGMFQLFYFGFAFGGPAFFWTWPLVFFGQMMVCLCFAELAGKYPIAGSVYNWSKQLSSKGVSWMAGWIMMTASIVTVAAVALAWQIILPQISSKFQIIGDGTGSTDFAKNAVLLGTILIIFTTAVNMIGVNLMAKINNVGVAAELIGATLLVLLLAVHITRGPGVVTKTYGTGTGHDWGYAGAFLVAALMSAYVMYGFDTAGSLGEETNNPRKYAPRSLVRALAAAGTLGALLILVGLMAVGNPHDPQMSISGLPFIVKDVLGSTLGDLFLWDVVLAITVCCLAVHTATIRIAFAMARDNNLPFGSAIARVHGKSRTPIVPAIVVGALAILILVININQPQIFTVITSIGIIMVYLAYLLVTVPMLQQRLRGEWQPAAEYFSLGQWGLLVNTLAVAYGAGMAFNLAWPRDSIYNFAPPHHWYLQYGAYLYIGVIAGLGGLYYYTVQRHKTGILPEHAAEPGLPAPVHGGP
jgi:urea carboxylase system permease